MSNKAIGFTPLILLVVGILFGIMLHDGKPPGYYLGFGIGLVLLSLAPAALFALIHWLIVRKNSQPEVEVQDNLDVLDSAKVAVLNKNYWYYCVRYQAAIGAFLAIAMLASQGRI
jgi:nitrate/nitrite transporter NarK